MPPKRRGRPPIFDVPATVPVSLRVTPQQDAALRRVAAENGTSVTGVIRDAVNEYVSDYDEHRQPFIRKP